MSSNIAEKDIFDHNGVLLLAKGSEIDSHIIEKLKQRVNYNPDSPIKSGYKAEDIANSFVMRKKIQNSMLLEQAAKILSSIIWDSKNKPWWRFVYTLENYVDWLYTHSVDVSLISLMMATELGYDEEKLYNIGLGSFLHDIGNILIPKSFLLKPTTLTDTELFYIKQHCELGISVLSEIHLPQECTDIILLHHERLDGSGYPKGLKGSELCENVKIVMVADAFDAITSYRPYRQSQTMDAAIKILKTEKGQYPQELVDLFLEKIL